MQVKRCWSCEILASLMELGGPGVSVSGQVCSQGNQQSKDMVIIPDRILEVNGLRGRRGFNFDRESYEEPHRGSSEKNPKRSEQGVHHRYKRGFTKFGKDCGESLGAKHNAKPTVSLGSFVDLGRTERGACKSGHGGLVCDGDIDYKTRHVGLCKSFFRDAKEDGFGKRDVEAVGSGVEGRRSSHSVRTGKASRPCYFDHMGNGTGGASENGFVNSLENSSEMGGGLEIGESQFHFHFCEGNSCGLVGCPKGKKGRSIQTVQMGSYKGIIDNGDCSGVTDVGKVCVSDKGVNEESRIMEERHSNEGLFCTFDKKRSDIIHNESDVELGENRRDCNGKIVETFLEERSVFGGNNKVWRKPGRHGSCIKNKRDNRIVIKKHNICRRPKRSVLPRTLEEKESPLHVTKIEPMSTGQQEGK